MAETKQGKKNRKIGRQAHHPSHVNYTHSHQREHNKMRRIVQSSGHEAGLAYALKCSQKGFIIRVPEAV